MFPEIFQMSARTVFRRGATQLLQGSRPIAYTVKERHGQSWLSSLYRRAIRQPVRSTHQNVRQSVPKPMPKPAVPNHQGQSSYRLLKALGFVGGGLATTYTLSQISALKRHREALKNIEAIKRSFERMTAELERKQEAAEKIEAIRDLSLAVNEAITNSNLEDFDDMYTELLKVIGGEPSLEYKKQLIHHLAQTAKVSFLRKLCTSYKMKDLVADDELAKRVMGHPDCEAIEAVASRQFWPGPGSIRADGAKAFLAHQQEADLEYAENGEGPDVYGLDSIDDAAVVINFLKERHASVSHLKELYDHIAVMPIDETGSLGRYAEAIKDFAEKRTGKTRFPFVLTGAHFTYGEVEVNHLANGKFEIRSLYVDSLGASIGTDPGSWMVASLLKAFPSDTKLTHYVAENKIQHSENGCSIFALNDFNVMLHTDEVLPNLPQYRGKLPKEGSLWAYMDMQEPLKVKGKTHIFYGEGIDDCEERTYYYHLATMPAAYSRQKQSLNRHGRVDGFDLERAEREGYDYTGHEYESKGQMGINKELEASSASRRQEMTQPYRHDSLETPNDYLKTHLKPNARGKKQNFSRDDIYEWGHQLVTWLLNKPKGFVYRARQSFDLEAFIDRHSSDEALSAKEDMGVSRSHP